MGQTMNLESSKNEAAIASPVVGLIGIDKNESPCPLLSDANVSNNLTESDVVEEENLVEETLRLIEEGNRKIPFDPNRSDSTLVAGYTGAGKTTITGFIAELSDLEAYDAGDRFLVRDKHHKISENSTMVSQTIFPDMHIDKQTNSVFYDLPGSGDTRSSAVEIANAYFMKRVAENSKRVKFLFIVNYESVLSGGTRTGFLTFLQHAIKLVKYPAKFKSSIALVATKVESSRDQERIVNGISTFLSVIKTDLPEVMSDAIERKAAENLIDAILSKDSSGNYSRISFFRQPDGEGPLDQIPSVMSQRPHILNVVYNNTNFTETTGNDFGSSLSPRAKLLVLKVAAKINHDLALEFKNISDQWTTHYKTVTDTAPLETLGEQLEQEKKIEEIISKLSSSKSRQEFFHLFETLQIQVNANGLISDATTNVYNNGPKNLEFLESVLEKHIPAPILDWVAPIAEFALTFKSALTEKSAELNNQMESHCAELVTALTNQFNTLVQNTGVDIPIMEQTVQKLSFANETLVQMTNSLEKSQTIMDFVNKVQQNVPEIDLRVGTTNFIKLTQDIKIESEDETLPSPFIVISWVKPFLTLSAFLVEEISKFRIDLQNEKHRLESEEAERIKKNEEEEQEGQRKEREAQEAKEKEEAERKRLEHEERLRVQREAQLREFQEELKREMWREVARQMRGGSGLTGMPFGFRF